jgi:hypothetical protein
MTALKLQNLRRISNVQHPLVRVSLACMLGPVASKRKEAPTTLHLTPGILCCSRIQTPQQYYYRIKIITFKSMTKTTTSGKTVADSLVRVSVMTVVGVDTPSLR